jgi:hypothetical protein
MATYGRVKIGRLVLREDHIVSETIDQNGDRSITVTGQESMGVATGYALSLINQKREDLLAITDQVVPVVFDRKSNFNGYYQATITAGTVENHDGLVAMFPWSMTLVRMGTEQQIDVESRLGGAITRANVFSVTGVRCHAPSVGHIGYQTGSTIPLFTTRPSADGSLIFYRTLAAGVNPRWACAVTNYEKGRVRFIDSNLYERSGVDASVAVTGWELSNGLIRVKPLASGGVLEVSVWTGSAWHVKNYDVTLGTGPAVSVGTFDYCAILENKYEFTSIRLMKNLSPGRFTLDLSLRRGHRFVEMYAQHDFSTTIKIVRSTVEAGTRPGGTGYVVATSNDADTNKYIIGSSQAFTDDLVNGGMSKASTATLDAFIGIVAGGTGAITGDTATDIYAQYIGSPSELIRGIRR